MRVNPKSSSLLVATALSLSNPFASTCRAEVASELQELLSPSDVMHRRLSSLPTCPYMEVSAPVHSDDACDRAGENDATLHHFMLVDGNYRTEEKTWICPDDDEITSSAHSEGEHAVYGAPTRWIVRNKSSGSVILSWLKVSSDGTGARVEASAANPKIIPAHHDPETIIGPGQFHSVRTVQGHLFQVREVLIIGGEIVPGRVLLRHRTGLIPVRNRLAKDTATCPESAMIHPNRHTNHRALSESSQRTPPSVNKRCNHLKAGFTNKVGCPVDLYWAGSSNSVLPQGADVPQEDVVYGAKCREEFKMHLGVNPYVQNLDEWSSQIKYESTLLNHRFVARLRHDPSIVVDDITIEPGIIMDCPSRKTKLGVGSSGIGGTVSVSIEVPDTANATHIMISATKSFALGTNSSITTHAVSSNFTALPTDVEYDVKAQNYGTEHPTFTGPSLAATIISHSSI